MSAAHSSTKSRSRHRRGEPRPDRGPHAHDDGRPRRGRGHPNVGGSAPRRDPLVDSAHSLDRPPLPNGRHPDLAPVGAPISQDRVVHTLYGPPVSGAGPRRDRLSRNPPQRAGLLCVEEKTQARPSTRCNPAGPCGPAPRSHAHQQHGTTSRFCALNVQSGEIGDTFYRHHRTVGPGAGSVGTRGCERPWAKRAWWQLCTTCWSWRGSRSCHRRSSAQGGRSPRKPQDQRHAAVVKRNLRRFAVPPGKRALGPRSVTMRPDEARLRARRAEQTTLTWQAHCRARSHVEHAQAQQTLRAKSAPRRGTCGGIEGQNGRPEVMVAIGPLPGHARSIAAPKNHTIPRKGTRTHSIGLLRSRLAGVAADRRLRVIFAVAPQAMNHRPSVDYGLVLCGVRGAPAC